MVFDELSEDNFFHYASSNYAYKYCKTIQDFHEDLDRFKYLKRLFTRYQEKGELRERLILNHLIILANVFEVKPAVKMLFFKIDKKHHSALKTFLVYLNYVPDTYETKLPIDDKIANKLREI